jgi:hypothetical protein
MLEAWDEIDKKYPDRAWWRRKATHAGLMWEYAIQHLLNNLGDDVRAVPHNDTMSLIFDDRLLLRPKKADYELKTKNYPTPTALLFHEPEADLFGFTGLQRAEVVYVPNRFETAIEWVGIVARNAWSFELEDAPAAVEALPLAPMASAKDPADVATLKKNSDAKRDRETE